MILNSTLKSLQILLGEGISGTQLDITASWGDYTSVGLLPGANDTVSNGVTAVTAVAAPGTNVQRSVSEIRVHNNDSIPHHVILRLNNNGTFRIVQERLVQSTEDFVYTATGAGIQANGSGGNVVNFGSPTAGQIAEWVDANTIQGVDFVTAFAGTDLSTLPTADPGGGKPWLNGGVLQVGA